MNVRPNPRTLIDQTCIILRINLQILFVPRNWIVDRDDEVGHVLSNILLAVLLKNAGTVRNGERPVTRKTDQDSFEKIVT